MTYKSNADAATVTRRGVLRGGFAGALGCLALKTAPAQVSPLAQRADLYVFAGSAAGTTAIAVTWPLLARQDSEIWIHAGTRDWNIGVRQNFPQRGFRLFIGRIVSEIDGPIRNAVVIEAPSATIAEAGAASIWAERLTPGTRERIGSPFLSEILAGNPRLAEIYDASAPADDHSLLTKCVAKSIAEKARASGRIHDPDGHGRRLASVLLPDVLLYDPKLPVGFTFAGRNGRHPEEQSAVVANTILANSSTPAGGMRHRLEPTFPYFRQS